jgi:mono/diheme cytochrome c family protein
MVRTFTMLLLTAALAACGSTSAAAPKTTPSEPVATGAEAPKEMPKPAEPGRSEPATAEPVKEDPKPDPKAALLASETSAWEAAKPAFAKYCATCHTKDGKKAAKKKLDHFDMDTYPLGGHHTSTIGFTIREVLGLAGKKATMPYDKPGSVKGDELAAIKAWTDSWEAAEKAGAHPPANHPSTF